MIADAPSRHSPASWQKVPSVTRGAMSGSFTFVRQAGLTLLERNVIEEQRLKYHSSIRIVFKRTIADYLFAHEAKGQGSAASEVSFSDLAMGLAIYVRKKAPLLRPTADVDLGLSAQRSNLYA